MLNSESVIEDLSKQLSIKPRLRPLKLRATWLALFVLSWVALYLVQVYGLRPDLSKQLETTWFLLELGIGASLSMSAFLYFVRFSLPRGESSPVLVSFWMGVHFVAMFLLFVQLGLAPTRFLKMENIYFEMSSRCFGIICLVTAFASLSFSVFVRRGATTFPVRSGIFVSISAAALGFVTLSLTCPSQDPLHIFVSHFIPLTFFSLLGPILGRAFFTW